MIFTLDALKDRVAIITGGGTGLGRAMALEFAKVGAKLVIASRNLDHLNPTAEEIRALGRPCLVVQTDVRQPDQVNEMVRRTVEEFGRLDILVNNAAGNFGVKAEELSVNGWNSVINIDLNGTFYCSQAAAKVMIPQGGGNILNITVAYLNQGAPGTVHAASAKGGIWLMTKSLAAEWGRFNIRVNAIAPGPFPNPETARVYNFELNRARTGADGPLGRVGRDEEIGWAAIFLVSDAAAFITGETLFVDGGTSLGRWPEGLRP